MLDFAWWMKKGGYAESTIVLYTTLIKILIQRGANIHDPESVKEIIAKQQWSDSARNNAIAAYTLLLKMTGRTWQPPICHVTRKLPFIPTELELDQMIAGCGKKTATFLQTLKETAMRSGEVNSLRWIDIDTAKRTITLNHPEKTAILESSR